MKSKVRPYLASLAAATAVAMLVGCSQSPSDEQDLTVTIAVESLVSAYNPLLGEAADGGYELDAYFDKLMYWDQTSDTFRPWLAEKVTYSDDRQTAEIKLREDVDFVDGIHMDAAGVEAYLDALFQSDNPFLGSVLPYEPEATATSEYVVTITTTKPMFDGDFGRAIFGYIPILSPGAIDDPEAASASPMGSGPYIIQESDPEVEKTLVRNPNYWNPEAFPYDTVIFKVMPDPVARLNALNSGQVDVGAITTEMSTAAEEGGLTVVGTSGLYYSLIVQNPTNSPAPALQDVRVRQAIMLAFDRQAIVDTIQLGFGTVTDQPFVEGSPQWIDGGLRYEYDPERARELMAEAGYADGFDVTIPSGGGVAEASYQPIVQQSLADIGIRVTYEQFPDFLSFIAAALGGQYPLILTNNGFNETLRILTEEFPGYGQYFVPTPEIFDLVETIKGVDPEAGAEASRTLGELILDEAYFITFAAPLSLTAASSDVSLVLPDGSLGIRLDDVKPAD